MHQLHEHESVKGIPKDMPLVIGSVVVPGDCSAVVYRNAAELAMLTEHPDIASIPQTPQEGFGHFMDQQAVIGLPWIIVDDDSIHYDVHVEADDGGGSGACNPREKDEEFWRLMEDVLFFLEAVQAGNIDEINRILNKVEVKYPSIAWMPKDMEAMLIHLKEELAKDSENSDPFWVKFQISGAPNTAEGISALDEQGEVKEDFKISLNRAMLEFHSGLVLMRTFFWSRSIHNALDGITNREIKLICSTDEPNFVAVDESGGGLRLRDILFVYDKLFSRASSLPYVPKIHICGRLLPELFKYFDLVNFDAWRFGQQLSGIGVMVADFFKKDGRFVLGIIPVDTGDLIKAFEHLIQEENVDSVVALMTIENLEEALYIQCIIKLSEIVERLEGELRQHYPSMKERELRQFILDHILISPQCGLGGLTKYDRVAAAELTEVIYEVTQRLATAKALL